MSEENNNNPENQPAAQQPQANANNNMGKSVPNATAVLVLGICSIVLCFCYGFIGAACAIIALVIAKKGRLAYEANPGLYLEGSYKNLKAGKICAIIGLILSSMYLLFILVYVVFLGAALTAMPWKEIMQHAHEHADMISLIW